MELYQAKLDPDYQNPVFDADEIRTRTLPDGSEKSYRYMHGSFPEKNVKFSFCIPLREDYEGRFFQNGFKTRRPERSHGSFVR